MRPLRILHTEASLGWGGQEIRIFEECQWFQSRGHEVHVAVPKHSQLFDNLGDLGFPTHGFTFTRESLVGDLFRMWSLIRKVKPDVVATHSSMDSWAGLVAASLARIPCRVRYRHVSTRVKPHLFNRWQYRSLCDFVLTTGECIRQPLMKQFHLDSVIIQSAPTAVKVPDQLPDRKTSRNQIQEELGLSGDARFVGQVSVLRSWKGHGFLLDAFAQIADKHPEYHLLIVGDGPQEPMLRDKLTLDPLADRIHLTGYRPEPWRYFRGMDVAILASVSNEGIPQSLLQSMYAGTPVIGTNVGGIPEIVRHEKTGLLADPSDAVSLAACLAKLLGDESLRSNVAEVAQKHVREKFQWDALGERLEKMFADKVESSGR